MTNKQELEKKVEYLKQLIKAMYNRSILQNEGTIDVKLTTNELKDLIQAEKSILELEKYIEDNY